MKGDSLSDDFDPDDSEYPFNQFEGPVYYDPATHRFLQLRERHEDHLVFGGSCGYFDDAKTYITIQKLPTSCLERLVLVEDITHFDQAEQTHNGFWCVKGYVYGL